MSSSSSDPSASPSAVPSLPRVVFFPGMGCSPVATANWYSSVADSLRQLGYEVILRDFPEPNRCYESVWMQFIRDELKVTESDIVIGHSTGSIAAQRYLESSKLLGCILVSTYWSDLDNENERLSGYFGRPWNWDAIKSNCGWIGQWHGTNDHFVPVSEARSVAEFLGSQYIEEPKGKHFLTKNFPDIVDFIEFKCKGKIKITNPIIPINNNNNNNNNNDNKNNSNSIPSSSVDSGTDSSS